MPFFGTEQSVCNSMKYVPKSCKRKLHNSSGTTPTNSFPEATNNAKVVISPISVGNTPVNSLSLIRSWSNNDNLLMLELRVPLNLFSKMSTRRMDGIS